MNTNNLFTCRNRLIGNKRIIYQTCLELSVKKVLMEGHTHKTVDGYNIVQSYLSCSLGCSDGTCWNLHIFSVHKNILQNLFEEKMMAVKGNVTYDWFCKAIRGRLGNIAVKHHLRSSQAKVIRQR